ncbi:hypothetical protein GTY41_03770 [Streptomyces sp. SID685]|uniref:hypothetical protein n=1 Tax=Streptomyces sp. SID685 TaxID=2690322 RepID=UPI00137121A0|nr:hypothetical protein [Streptomyces sp. SID685]MYR84083.1 hypothetical protein [Streptomyces sp. SID685]
MSSVNDRYKAALIEEHDSYVRGGRAQDAKEVARILKEQYDHDVDEHDDGEEKPKLVPTLPERADAPKPPENTDEPKPRRGPRAKQVEGDGK